ncbi:MAG TPA: biotin--[acetyl-CoA-carboxylase] ligase [Candidatus Paceibacterota bacterium]|nr:biotin--[acetyl-CoA-carboxylase] ligase [Candidatus Paceibacterota bacterium]HSA03108.1 biotin--[acetyl-CoA-carboxylase] ligase [Candidatus Paceibacterota bacterium]
MIENAPRRNTEAKEGYRIVRLAQVDSTNAYARMHLADLADGHVVTAEVQTAGRGRGGRAWISHQRGNLYLSLVLKPKGPLTRGHPVSNLSQLLAVVVCEDLESCQVTAGIKWPNDILVQGRKIGGILAEAVTSGSDLIGLVLGLGLNLNLQAVDLGQIGQPATSLNLLTGRTICPEERLKSILDRFFSAYPRVLANGFRTIRTAYVGRCSFLGQSVKVNMPEGVLCGQAIDITTQGELELLLSGGQVRRISLGEII